MCNFLSGVITREKSPRIFCRDLLHHENTVAAVGLQPEEYREWEWTQEDSGATLTVRAAPGENPNVLRSAILARYPRRVDLLSECLRQVAEAGGWLDLSSLTAIPEGLKLPENVHLSDELRRRL